VAEVQLGMPGEHACVFHHQVQAHAVGELALLRFHAVVLRDRGGDVLGRGAVAVGGQEIAAHEVGERDGIVAACETEGRGAHFSTKARSKT
jgi:hypothetical protein